MNFVDPITHHARFNPTALAVCSPGTGIGLISYGRLDVFMRNISLKAYSLGLRPGNVVAICINDPIVHLALILGLSRVGIVTLSVLQPETPPEISLNAIIAEKKFATNYRERVLVFDMSWVDGNGSTPEIEVEQEQRSGDSAARIVLTAGTTGGAKGVILSHENIVRRLHAYDASFGSGYTSSLRTFLDVGLSTSWGFALSIHALSRGGALFYRGIDAAETMQAFGLYGVQCMVAAPAGLAEFLQYYEESPDFVCPFETILVGGGLLSGSLSERVRARMCTHLIAGYASTEISPAAAAPAHKLSGIKGAVGYVVPWVDLQAVDDNDRPLPAGQEGRLRMRGHTMVSGYIGNPQGAEKFFRNGWFYPGDIGMLMADGLLIVSGREDAVLNLGGNKIHPEKIEMALLSCDGVVHAAAFTQVGDLGVDSIDAAVVVKGNVDAEAIRSHCAKVLPSEFVPKRVLIVPDIPRNDMGRIDRAKLQQSLAGKT